MGSAPTMWNCAGCGKPLGAQGRSYEAAIPCSRCDRDFCSRCMDADATLDAEEPICRLCTALQTEQSTTLYPTQSTSVRRSGRLQTFAAATRRGWLHRAIRLQGEVEATVEYNGWGAGYESVLVDGQEVSRRQSTMWFVPEFDFSIRCAEGPVPARLEVRVAPWLRIRALRLTVAGTVVYAEGRWADRP
jgi:hypothetical protein